MVTGKMNRLQEDTRGIILPDLNILGATFVELLDDISKEIQASHCIFNVLANSPIAEESKPRASIVDTFLLDPVECRLEWDGILSHGLLHWRLRAQF
jgi:hypothetical protein